MATTKTREGWLDRAVIKLLKRAMAAHPSPPAKAPSIKVSCGFPSKGALAAKSRRIGECWPAGSGNGHVNILISPLLTDVVAVLEVLLHELVHAVDGNANGHKGPFVAACKALGFEGKPTANYAGEALRSELAAIAAQLGEYPHAGLDGQPPHKKQSTRMLKLTCPVCGFVCRAARKPIEEKGLPTHCDEDMELED